MTTIGASVFAAAAIVAVTRAVNAGPAGDGRDGGDRGRNGYLYLHAAVYLAAFALLWGTALPAYAEARRGITGQGTPIGSLPYAAGCAFVCVALLSLAFRVASARRRTPAALAAAPG